MRLLVLLPVTVSRRVRAELLRSSREERTTDRIDEGKVPCITLGTGRVRRVLSPASRL